MYALQVRSAPLSARQYDVTGARLAVVKGDDEFGIKVAGTSRHQDALESIAGGRHADGAHERCAALLLPEPNNRHDMHAVGVLIEGTQIGYLERHQAPIFNLSLKRSGCVAAVCAAKIVGGGDRGDSDRGHFDVRLNAFAPFEIERSIVIEAEVKAISPPAAPIPISGPAVSALVTVDPPPNLSHVLPAKRLKARLREPIGFGLWTTGALSVLTIATVITLAKYGYAPRDDLSQAAIEVTVARQTASLPIPSRDLFMIEMPSAFATMRR